MCLLCKLLNECRMSPRLTQNAKNLRAQTFFKGILRREKENAKSGRTRSSFG
jgi:hypothetical protein